MGDQGQRSELGEAEQHRRRPVGSRETARRQLRVDARWWRDLSARQLRDIFHIKPYVADHLVGGALGVAGANGVANARV